MESQLHEARRTPSAADLFDHLWQATVELVGTPAAAALLRRAVKRAGARRPGAVLPAVERQHLDYAVALPPAWNDPSRPEALEELRRLVREDLDPLFRELTGGVITARLARIPELRAAGIIPEVSE